MNVEVHLYSQSQPIILVNVRNAYVKDGLYCVMFQDRTAHKFPLQHIFRIIEEES